MELCHTYCVEKISADLSKQKRFCEEIDDHISLSHTKGTAAMNADESQRSCEMFTTHQAVRSQKRGRQLEADM
jgi:hypothetical protein